MFAEDPKCPKCGTVYNRGPVIREIKKLSPWLFESAVWTTRFKCLKCREEITISGVRGE